MNLSAEERTDLLVKQGLDRVNLFVGSSCSFLVCFFGGRVGLWAYSFHTVISFFCPLVLHVYFCHILI